MKTVDNGKVETFVLSQDGTRIHRFVITRNGKKVRTVFGLNKSIKTTQDSHEHLASLADQMFIRSKRQPRGKERGRFIRVADLFSGCGAMSVGVQEACRALGLRFKSVLSIDLSESASNIYQANFPEADVKAVDIRKIFRGKLQLE